MFEFLKKIKPDKMNEKSALDAWQSMASREFKIMDLLNRHPSMAIKTFDMMFKSIFPYAGNDLEFEIGLNPEKTQVELNLFHGGDEKLKADEERFAAMMPVSLRERWIVHVEE